jgi:hypothetical protein
VHWPWRRHRPDLDAITEDAERRLKESRKAANGGLKKELVAQQKVLSDQLAKQNRIAEIIRDGFRI